MNVTIVNPPIPYKFEKTPYVPLGIGYIAAAIRKAEPDTEIRFVDGQILPVPEFWTEIEHIRTHVLLISATIRQMKNAQRIATIVKSQNPDTWVILGGPGPSGFTVIPETTDIDAVVQGEAEELVPLILCGWPVFNWEGIPSSLAGIVRESGRFILTVKKPPDVNAVPYPDRSIFDQAAYSARWRETAHMTSVSLIGSRGCPFHCIFCDHSVTGRGVRYRAVENIAEEMIRLQEKYNPDDIFFYDDLFTVKKSRVHALCEHLRSSRVPIVWSAQGRVDCITESMLEDMLSAGCSEIEFGVESGSDKILTYFRKGVTREQIIRAFALCHKVGMHAGAYLIIGVPGETRQDILDTVSLVEEIRPALLNLSYLTPFPATELYALTHQWIDNIDYERWDDFRTSPYNFPFEVDPRESERMIMDAYQRMIDAGLPHTVYDFSKDSTRGGSNEP